MRTSEGTAFLRRTLAGVSNLTTDQVGKISAHSLKVTALSWCAKRAVPAGVRRLLGYHVKPKDRSPATYARDAMAEPLRALEGVIKDITSGVFSLTRRGPAGLLPLRQVTMGRRAKSQATMGPSATVEAHRRRPQVTAMKWAGKVTSSCPTPISC